MRALEATYSAIEDAIPSVSPDRGADLLFIPTVASVFAESRRQVTAETIRERVTQRIKRSFDFPITVVGAPAGFGKTIAVQQFLRQMDVPYLYLRVTAATPADFMRDFSSQLRETYQALPSAGRALSIDATTDMSWLDEGLCGIAHTIVLDDIEKVTDRSLLLYIRHLIESTIPVTKWILITRHPDELPIAAWMAYGSCGPLVTQDDLAFTDGEARELMASADCHSLKAVVTILSIARGWPAALAVGIQMLRSSPNHEVATSETREVLFAYLADLVFRDLPSSDFDLLLRASLLPRLDEPMLAVFLPRELDRFRQLAERLPLLERVQVGAFIMHELLRNYLQVQASSQGGVVGQLIWLARELENHKSYAESLDLFISSGTQDEVRRVLRAHGFSLLDAGHLSSIRSALQMLQVFDTDPTLMAIQAVLDVNEGALDTARSRFTAAMEMASGDEQKNIGIHFASELVSVRDEHAVPVLECLVREHHLAAPDAARVFGLLARILATHGHRQRALLALDSGLPLLRDLPTDCIETSRLYCSAARVHYMLGDLTKARQFAYQARSIGQANNHNRSAAAAEEILHDVAYEEDNAAECLRAAEEMLRYATASGRRELDYRALIHLYHSAVLAGDEEETARLNAIFESDDYLHRRILVEDPTNLNDAVRIGWTGDFERAFQRARGTEKMMRGIRKVSRLAHVAVYAAAAGDREYAEVLLKTWRDRVGGYTGRRIVRSYLNSALAFTLLGDHTSARRCVTMAEDIESQTRPATAAWIRATRAFYLYGLDRSMEKENYLKRAINELCEHGLGGVAKTLWVLRSQLGQVDVQIASLTNAEREILDLLMDGLTTPQIAGQTDRAPKTVDYHVQQLCRKLGVRRRTEAIALMSRRFFGKVGRSRRSSQLDLGLDGTASWGLQAGPATGDRVPQVLRNGDVETFAEGFGRPIREQGAKAS